MELDLLLHFCELEATTYQLPYTIYDDKKNIYCSSTNLVDIDFLTPIQSIFERAQSNVNYYITKNFLIFGFIKSKDDNKLLFIGPSAIGVLSDEDINKNITIPTSKMTPEQKIFFERYLRECPVIPISKFLNALSAANCLINREVISIQ